MTITNALLGYPLHLVARSAREAITDYRFQVHRVHVFWAKSWYRYMRGAPFDQSQITYTIYKIAFFLGDI